MAGCGEYNEGLDKPAALLILRWLLQGEDDWVAGGVSVKSRVRVLVGRRWKERNRKKPQRPDSRNPIK
eukprot:6620704-Prymnesium_polylepis.1